MRDRAKANASNGVDTRTPEEWLDRSEEKGRKAAEAPAVLRHLTAS